LSISRRPLSKLRILTTFSKKKINGDASSMSPNLSINN
jgi:hypothetical protein